jgi:hypothetical protein
MPHLPPAHHETSKRDSSNGTKVKEKQNKIVPDSKSNLAKSMTHHNQTKELTTWFLIMIQPLTSCCDLEEPSLRVIPQGALTNIALIPTIKDEVIAIQKTSVGMGHIQRKLSLGEAKCFQEDFEGVLWFKDRLVVPKDFDLCRKIMDKAHSSKYSIHPGTNKMYQDLKKKL